MARLNTKELQIKVSKLQKDIEEDDTLLDMETMIQLESIISELVGSSVIVEITDNQ
jgi:hypothetical protein